MFKIAICDDEKPFQKAFRNVIVNYMDQNKIEYSIDTFCSGKELLELGVTIVQYSVIFLDINMEEMDGIDTAMKIRAYSQDIYIVFVTAYVKYSLEGYKVSAIRYLLKSNKNFDNTVYECMDAIIRDLNYEKPKKVFDFKEGRKEILIDRIIYVESSLHTVKFYIMENEIKTYTIKSTLNETEQELAEYSFMRIHQSYLVNLKHVKNIKTYLTIMDDGTQLPIPRTKYREIKELFVAHKGEL